MTTINPNELSIADIMLLADCGVYVEINNGEIKLFMEV